MDLQITKLVKWQMMKWQVDENDKMGLMKVMKWKVDENDVMAS